MRIVYLSSSTIPSRTANSIHVMKMCQAFAKNGHEVVLISQDKKKESEPFVEDVFEFYGVKKCFNLVKIKYLSLPAKSIIYGFQAALIARRIDPDLVFSRNIAGALFSARFGLNVIFEYHMPIVDSGPIKEWPFRYLIKSPRMQKLIVITHSLKEYYENQYPVIRDKVQVVPDAADPLYTNIQSIKLPNRGKRLQVGYIGHLYRGRGIKIIIELAKKCRWADFHLVGGTKIDILHWKNKSKHQTNIYFHGFVTPSEAVKFCSGLDVLLAPYQQNVSIAGGGYDTSRWMSPLKVFEYMASKRPIIASDLPVLREILEHERNALLCPPDDVHAWVRCLELLRDEPDLGKRLAEAAYDDFITKHTWTRRAQTVLGDCT